VIVPPYTSPSTASAVLQVNTVPIVADAHPTTYCPDPAEVERAVTGN
jgi:dTDP-4-amino-4,6-dideoxygalactose transaminase